MLLVGTCPTHALPLLPQVRASRVPGPEEDREVAHSAFMNAYGKSHHGPHISGMQEFAGAVSASTVLPRAGRVAG